MRRYSIACFALCLIANGICRATVGRVWSLEDIVKAPILATAIVVDVRRSDAAPDQGVVPALATLRVLRTFPQSAIAEDQEILLNYKALPSLNGQTVVVNPPNVPELTPGAIWVFPLQRNLNPSTDAWRLITDNGDPVMIRAAMRKPLFSSHPANGVDYLLQEVASALATGEPEDVFAQAGFATGLDMRQQDKRNELMQLLVEGVGQDQTRWTLIAASLLIAQPNTEPTVAEFLRGIDNKGVNQYPLVGAVIRKLVPRAKVQHNLIHQLLGLSDPYYWAAGITLQQFARDPSLLRELRAMLKSRRPGSLDVARGILTTGQKQILPDAMAAALEDIDPPSGDPSELRTACTTIRDLGSDRQFDQLVRTIRKYQYANQEWYDRLWTSTIGSYNERERTVLEILLNDDRTYHNQPYKGIANLEIFRLDPPHNTIKE